MKSNELRIGNIVSIGGRTEHLTRNGLANILLDKFVIELKPIPLTEEWLIKFGFNCVDDREWADGVQKSFVINDGSYGKLSDYFRVYWRDKRYDTWVDKLWPKKVNDINGQFYVYLSGSYARSVGEVHDLQNLYFALTGEELTIKEKP